MKSKNKVLIIVAALSGAILVYWVLLWIQLFACFPPEQVYRTAVSPDGSRTARFSVKYEGLCRWLPYDIEPHYYITVVESDHGWFLSRESAYAGDLKASFSALAKKHAPWAVPELAVNTR